MTSRTLKLLELARQKYASDNLKNVEYQNVASSNKENQIATKVLHSDQRTTNNSGDIFISTFFEPIVKNETESSANCFVYEMEKLQAFLIDNEDFDSDDSIQDPDFKLPSELENLSGITDLVGISPSVVLQPLNQNNVKESRKIKQKNRNTGKSYINKGGKIIPERKCEPLESRCRKKCHTKLCFPVQKQLFENYWNLGTYNQRILFIGSLIQIEDKKSQTLDKNKFKPRNRQHVLKYNLEIEGKMIDVCQKCFLQCFGETESFIKSVVKKKLLSPNLEFSDCRGSSTPPNKFDEKKIEEVKQHINSFPMYESHYTRRDTSKKYFHSDLTISQMYRLYRNQRENPVSLSKYSNIFKSMNIKFKSPKVDTCKTCDLLKAKIDFAKSENSDDLEILKKDQASHHLEADFAFKAKDKDKMISKTDSQTKTYTFDLQQCLPTPLLQNSLSFYKRQLWTYNLTIHDCSTNEPFCFMWHEAMGKRGGNEIASCVFKHLKLLSTNTGINSITLYSDSCPGQNKNSHMSAMFTVFIYNNDHIKTIDHKFLVPGHTHMECDVDHSIIERKKKKTKVKIHHPHDWYNFVRSVGTKSNFNVIEMRPDDFFDFASLLKDKLLWRNKNDCSEKFVWNNVKWLRYKKHNFGKIFYKTSLNEDEPFKMLDIKKRGINSISINEIPKLPQEVQISEQKKKDLLDLLPFIDPSFHKFYKDLKTDVLCDIHPDLAEDEQSE